MVMTAQTLYAAVTVARRGTTIFAFNLSTKKVDSQVALQVCAEHDKVFLIANDCRVWALCNVRSQGYFVYTILHIEEGLMLHEERKLSNQVYTNHFV